jgi:hypothetical protein
MNESLERSDDEFAQDDLLESPEAPIDFIAEARQEELLSPVDFVEDEDYYDEE